MNSPVVTVFIPCYNAGRFIAETIDSILVQTYQDFEILIIDDGSTDNSSEILNKYAEKDERIRILKNKRNRGIGYTRNRGVREARGKYLAIMDADDVSVPARLEKEVQYLEKNQSVGAVSGCAHMINEQGRKLGRPHLAAYSAQEVRAQLFFRNVIVNSASMYRLDIVRNHNVKYKDDYHGVEDYMFWCMLINYTDIEVLGECFVYYRIVDSGLTITNIRKNNAERLKCINEIHQYMLKKNGFHINRLFIHYYLPQYVGMLPKGGVKNTIAMFGFFTQMLIQAKLMKKSYYLEMREFVVIVMKKKLSEILCL